MHILHKYTIKFTVSLSCAISLPLFATELVELPTITVEDSSPEIDRQLLDPHEDTHFPVDGGSYLRQVTGVSGIRMGGHGIDPMIRGQSETRLNILLDGAYVHGGCPNRMDPPTAYSNLETYDKVTVLKGNKSVLYGGGGSGGTVLFERETAPFDTEKSWRGKVGGGYHSNGQGKNGFADIAVGNPSFFARGIGSYDTADNYKDGNGKEIRSGYTNKSGGLILGYTPNADTRLEFSSELIREKDVLFAGAGMDSPISDNDIFRLKFSQSRFNFELYQSDVDHVMDNFSLRPLTGTMKMRADTTSKTQGGRLSQDIVLNDTVMTVGIDLQKNTKNGTRVADMSSVAVPTTPQSLLWPDIELQQIGLFAESLHMLNDTDTMKLGLRYDRVSSQANKATEVIKGGSPNDLYRQYYGKLADKYEENNIGGFISVERQLNETDQLALTLSRSVRTADASERFIASNNATAGMRWVGNPDLEPEKHHQIELAWKQKYFNTNLFYDHVSDFILRDRAHGQAGILQQDNATIYRNVTAQFYGFEVESHWNITSEITTGASIAYVHANNTTDDRALAQIAPLEAVLNINYQQTQWGINSLLRLNAKQTRVDDNAMTGSGVDAGKSSGFGVLDLIGFYQATPDIQFKLGVENVFDKAYAYHVNRANADPFNPDAVRVNEPGRSFWLSTVINF